MKNLGHGGSPNRVSRSESLSDRVVCYRGPALLPRLLPEELSTAGLSRTALGDVKLKEKVSHPDVGCFETPPREGGAGSLANHTTISVFRLKCGAC